MKKVNVISGVGVMPGEQTLYESYEELMSNVDGAIADSCDEESPNFVGYVKYRTYSDYQRNYIILLTSMDNFKIIDMKNFIQIGDKKIPISEETAKEFKEQFKQPERIPCPIQMEDHANVLGIPFNDSKQILFYNMEVYKVVECYKHNLIDCDLIPCKREDLEPGDIAFASNYDDPNFTNKRYYHLTLNNIRYAYVSGGDEDVFTSSAFYENWWKVVKR